MEITQHNLLAKVASLFYPNTEYPSFFFSDKHKLKKVDRSIKVSDSSFIHKSAKIGEKSEIGYNTIIGPGVVIGRNSLIGDNVSIYFSLIGNNVKIDGGTGVYSNVDDNSILRGTPAIDINKFNRSYVHFKNLEKIVKDLNDLKKLNANNNQI